MKLKIKDVATIRSGAYMKESIEGSVYYLRVSDFNKEENTLVLPKPMLEYDCKIDGHLLLDGDIILAAKGVSNFGIVYREEMGKAVASSSFLIVRIVDCDVVLPDYLCWVLNGNDTLAFFKANIVGTAMPSISKSLLEEYIVDIPPKNIQKKIVEVNRLQQREQQLYQRIVSLRKTLIQKQLIEITKQ